MTAAFLESATSHTQQRVLAQLIFEFTLLARQATTDHQADGQTLISRVTRLNEAIHKVSGQLAAVLQGSPGYPYEVLFGDLDCLLAQGFKLALARAAERLGISLG